MRIIKNEEGNDIPHPDDVKLMTRYYLACALWSSNISLGDDYEGECDKELDGDPFDKHFYVDDFSDEDLWHAKKDCEDFLEECLFDNIFPLTVSPEQVGHDFWLTRNRHGVGFWDRTKKDGYNEDHLTKLTELSHSYGDCYVVGNPIDGIGLEGTTIYERIIYYGRGTLDIMFKEKKGKN